LKLAEKEFTKHHQIHSDIIESLKPKMRDCSAVIENIKRLNIGKKTYKEWCNETSRRLLELQLNFKNVRLTTNAGVNNDICSSEVETDQVVRTL
jgi:hypothetical protein